jgi:hypothetical protein
MANPAEARGRRFLSRQQCIEVQTDGATPSTVVLSTTGARLPQQLVFEAADLTPGQHVVTVTHRDAGPVAVDAIVVR